MNKTIATDLDGTLFYPKDKKNMISKKNLFFLQSFIDNGGKVVLISGRSMNFGIKVQKKLNRPCDIIAFNGASMMVSNKIVETHNVSNLEANDLVDEVKKTFKPILTVLMTNDGAYVDLRWKSKIVRRFLEWLYKKQGVYLENFIFDDKRYQECLKSGIIYKVLFIFGYLPKDIKRAANINKVIRNSYSHVDSSWSGLAIEVSAKGCNKGESLERYAQLIKAKKEDFYVVGDSGNDISMFKLFPLNSFAMNKAPHAVKKYAKYSIDRFEDLSRYIYKK